MDVSIIIVNHNTKLCLKDCLNSIYKHTKAVIYEIIVSDNGSTDDSINMLKNEFPGVILIENNANIGFGAANNRALNIAKGKYVLFLNSDTILLNNAVKMFFDFFENYPEQNKLGAIGCNLLNSTGLVIHSHGDFPSLRKEIGNRLFSIITVSIKTILYLLNIKISIKKDTQGRKIGKVSGSITGADLFMLNNSDASFDEDFLLYFEDVYMEYKLEEKGKIRTLIEGPEIIHLNGGSNIEKRFFLMHYSFSFIQNYISAIIYFKKQNKNTKLLKFLTIILLLNPLVIKDTKKYINVIKRL